MWHDVMWCQTLTAATYSQVSQPASFLFSRFFFFASKPTANTNNLIVPELKQSLYHVYACAVLWQLHGEPSCRRKKCVKSERRNTPEQTESLTFSGRWFQRQKLSRVERDTTEQVWDARELYSTVLISSCGLSYLRQIGNHRRIKAKNHF